MSGARFIKYTNLAGKQVPIYVASEVQHAGYKRLLDSIDPNTLNQTVAKVESAVENNRLFTASQASRTSSITITSMPHPSNEDPNEHSTVVAQDTQGTQVAKGHVTTDASKQQAAR
ncbi:hypothetical protein BU26DRAFT_601611 [Trematosphaeria pertusa]|uniref:Uncharacterized protein n=1 Tax=Trematosphaeria pertusa TaxID=390896 RepID=A0A6A6ISL2_9PLEO|nr:uncharacterized protein BU26DRAFT_601611 [Trematosphaeria pertusa]KAF2253494.1 hypothetical protein BU26DRAFT_601611 [Trematosphaeria pertusa]